MRPIASAPSSTAPSTGGASLVELSAAERAKLHYLIEDRATAGPILSGPIVGEFPDAQRFIGAYSGTPCELIRDGSGKIWCISSIQFRPRVNSHIIHLLDKGDSKCFKPEGTYFTWLKEGSVCGGVAMTYSLGLNTPIYRLNAAPGTSQLSFSPIATSGLSFDDLKILPDYTLGVLQRTGTKTSAPRTALRLLSPDGRNIHGEIDLTFAIPKGAEHCTLHAITNVEGGCIAVVEAGNRPSSPPADHDVMVFRVKGNQATLLGSMHEGTSDHGPAISLSANGRWLGYSGAKGFKIFSIGESNIQCELEQAGFSTGHMEFSPLTTRLTALRGQGSNPCISTFALGQKVAHSGDLVFEQLVCPGPFRFRDESSLVFLALPQAGHPNRPAASLAFEVTLKEVAAATTGAELASASIEVAPGCPAVVAPREDLLSKVLSLDAPVTGLAIARQSSGVSLVAASSMGLFAQGVVQNGCWKETGRQKLISDPLGVDVSDDGRHILTWGDMGRELVIARCSARGIEIDRRLNQETGGTMLARARDPRARQWPTGGYIRFAGFLRDSTEMITAWRVGDKAVVVLIPGVEAQNSQTPSGNIYGLGATYQMMDKFALSPERDKLWMGVVKLNKGESYSQFSLSNPTRLARAAAWLGKRDVLPVRDWRRTHDILADQMVIAPNVSKAIIRTTGRELVVAPIDIKSGRLMGPVREVDVTWAEPTCARPSIALHPSQQYFALAHYLTGHAGQRVFGISLHSLTETTADGKPNKQFVGTIDAEVTSLAFNMTGSDLFIGTKAGDVWSLQMPNTQQLPSDGGEPRLPQL